MAEVTEKFEPFADDSAVASVAGLTIENGRDEIVLQGDISFRKDLKSRGQLEFVIAHLQKIVSTIGDHAVAEAEVAQVAATVLVPNPFL